MQHNKPKEGNMKTIYMSDGQNDYDVETTAKGGGAMENKPYCKMVKEYYTLKPGTKTAYALDKVEEDEFTEHQYDNYVDAAPFFRRLGGSEYVERSYTCQGYKAFRITSKSPDRQEKRVARFYFWDPTTEQYDKY